jgi:glutamate-ammonia-ligase adenylyltransferase
MALVCDRSSYGVDLLCTHPEILEEVLRPEMLRRRKAPEDLAAELAAGRGSGSFASWLWLWVRAEQLRHAIGELLGFAELEQVESALTSVADAVLRQLASESGALVVALGKFGGAELTLGSDLDLLFLAREGEEERAAAAVSGLRATLLGGNPLGPTYAVDLRLRPHGEAGPLVPTLASLAAYHSREGSEAKGPGGQTWEKLPAGPDELRAVARWLGFPDEGAFWSEHTARMAETRSLVEGLASGPKS